MLHTNVSRWWVSLSVGERELLIELLYSLDLNEYVKMDCDGGYIELKGLDNAETGNGT